MSSRTVAFYLLTNIYNFIHRKVANNSNKMPCCRRENRAMPL